MAHKDYVARGRATKKKAPPPPRKLPWLRIAITVSLVAGFAYMLWSISRPSDQPVLLPEDDTPKQSLPAVNTDPLPEMPVEKYEYPDELEQSTVEVDVDEQEKSARPYLMQCGSFRLQGQAEEMRAKMAMQGLEAQVRASDGKNGRWYRVIMGPYDYKRDAESDRHVVQRIGISNCQIWYWNL